jgi:hypothetical protein
MTVKDDSQTRVAPMSNLTTLAADQVAAILDDASPAHITLMGVVIDPPV